MNARKKTAVLIGAVAAVSLLFAACGSSSSDSQAATTTTAMAEKTTIVSAAAANPEFSTLVKAVTTAGLVDTLSGPGPYTVFAPTDDAFAKLPAGTLEGLTPAQLKSILTYHVVAGEVMAADVKSGPVKTVNGEDITFTVSGDKVTITDAKGNTVNVVKTDITTDNGVIHVIDGVLMP
jgi:uncharacterized surface protein with fasciclin (FAS1) repeats